MRYSVCIDAVFGSENPVESIHKVREAGFSAFEFWSWENRDLEAIRAAAEENELQIACFCMTSGSLTDPKRRSEFLSFLCASVEAAERIGCKKLIALTGQDTGADREFQRRSIVNGLRTAAPIAEAAGITLILEPLNTLVNHAGYFLWQSSEAYEIVDAVGSESIRILFDIYHQQIMEGNLIPNIRAGGGRIAHFHVAGHPGRHEPQSGEIHYPVIVDEIRNMGYDGFVGLEFTPSGDPMECLREAAAWLPVEW